MFNVVNLTPKKPTIFRLATETAENVSIGSPSWLFPHKQYALSYTIAFFFYLVLDLTKLDELD